MPLIHLTAEELTLWRGADADARGYLRDAAARERMGDREGAEVYRERARLWRWEANTLGTPGLPPEREATA